MLSLTRTRKPGSSNLELSRYPLIIRINLSAVKRFSVSFCRYYDPIFQLAVPLLLEEEASKTKKVLMRGTIRIDHDYIKSEPKLAEESDEKPDTGEITSPSSVSDLYVNYTLHILLTVYNKPIGPVVI